jgi:hypothetical protein
MPPWVPILVSVSLFFSGLALGFAGKMIRDTTELKTKCNILECIPRIQEDIAALKTNDETFWRVLGPAMSKVILSPSHLNQDHLLNKLDEGHLNYDEALELSSRLAHTMDSTIDPMVKVAVAFKYAQVRCLLNDMDRQRVALKEPQCSHHTQTS